MSEYTVKDLNRSFLAGMVAGALLLAVCLIGWFDGAPVVN